MFLAIWKKGGGWGGGSNLLVYGIMPIATDLRSGNEDSFPSIPFSILEQILQNAGKR